jgi:hypothetical protein
MNLYGTSIKLLDTTALSGGYASLFSSREPSGRPTGICTMSRGDKLRYTPIFDTCVFIDAVDDAQSWAKLTAARPRHGWPLSWISLQQLLHGLSKSDGPVFLKSRLALNRACELCKGKILDPPIGFVQRRILQLSLPSFPSKEIRQFLQGVCVSKTRPGLDPQVSEIAQSCETPM